MKSPNLLSVDADDTAITGFRQTGPRSAATVVAPRDSVAPPRSGPPPATSWEADDALESEAPVREGEMLGGRYIVERMFAEGGMGIVCLGRHAQLDQPVAIKFLRRALSGRDSIVQRFLNEARALAALRSEHVVRVMDVGQLESGRPYLVMEHLDGIDLDALVQRDGPLHVERAVSYVLQVCEALAEAHALGIVHRDIKPENLFLWSGGPGKDMVKVLDFGLAKRLGASFPGLAVTGPQDSMGSPCYMSPEQITTPQLVDARTDVWSLGVVLHRLLTDTLPFGGESATEVFAHVLNAAPTPLPEVVPSLDAELDAIVRRCLEKTPEARYASIAELADALNGYLALRGAVLAPDSPVLDSADLLAAPDHPVSAPPPPLLDDTKIRIPGVHARWPGVLAALLMLTVAAIYQADRTGRIHLRDLTDGWLTAPPLKLGAPLPMSRNNYEPPLNLAGGVFAVEPALDANGAPTLRAEPERALNGGPGAEETAVSAVERGKRQAADRDYLVSPVGTLPHVPPAKIDDITPSDIPEGY